MANPTRTTTTHSSPVRILPAALALLAAAVLLSPARLAADAPGALLLDDFETGIGAWRTNDSTLLGEDRPALLAGIYPISDTPPGGGAQAAMVDFQPAQNAWASISLPIDGRQWAARDIGAISLWIKRSEAGGEVLLTLRANVRSAGGKTEDRSYYQLLRPTGKDWQRVTLRLFGFRTNAGDAFTPDLRASLYLLQFVKTGKWDHTRLYVDTIEARAAEQAAQQSPASPIGGREVITVDMSKDIGRCLGQVGFNLAANSPVIGPNRQLHESVARLAAELAPCVGRLRVADHFDPRMPGYDLVSLNASVNWLVAAGIRPLLCFSVPASSGTVADAAPERRLYQTAVDIAALRRAAGGNPYYELFEDPVVRGGGQLPGFPSVADLVTGYNHLAAGVINADRTARVGGPGFHGPDEWMIREFASGVDLLSFLSYRLVYKGPLHPGDPRLSADVLQGFTGGANDWSYGRVAEFIDEVTSRPELFITDWGVERATTRRQTARDDEAGDAIFLATSALVASRHVDKLLWSELIDETSGLIDARGRPRPAYWAAWLLAKYAPRGATCCALADYRSHLLVAGVRTKTSANIFMVNRTDGPTELVLRVSGVGTPTTVRERRLDLTETNEVRHTNLTVSTTQRVQFTGPGITVIQFIGGN